MKKLFSRSLLVFLLSLCSMVGYAQKKVLCEDFGSTALPTGWTSSGNGWQFRDSEALFNAKVENGTDTLITPLVSVADLTHTPTVTIDYYMKINGSKVNELSLLYRTSTSEAWKSLAQFVEKQDTITRVYTALPDDITGNVQVAVAVLYKDGGTTAIGYLAIENQRAEVNAPSDFRYESLTATNVRLLWGRSNSEYFLQNNLKVSTTPITDFTLKADVFDGNVKETYTTVENLKANTQYYAYLRYECEDNDYSPWAELQFKTPCAAVIPPYTENFEEELTDCYMIIKNSRRAEVSEAYPHNGTKAFQFLTNSNKYNYLFFPALEVDNLQDYQISFYVASEVTGKSYGREITVGIANSATEENFQEWKTISLPKGRQWERVTISFAGFKGEGKVVALRAGNAGAENHIFIDDVTLEKAEACPRPMFVTVSNVTYNSARISWVEAGNATEWNAVIATKQYADPNDCEPDATKGEYAGEVKTNPYEATNLLPQTTYYVYVQSACAEGDWTEVASFTTGKPVTLPYKQGFDRFDPDFYTNDSKAIPEQWLSGVRELNPIRADYDEEEGEDSYWYKGACPYVHTSNDHTGSAYVPAALLLRGSSLPSEPDGSYRTSYVMMPAMPDDVNKLLLSFWAYSNVALGTRIVVGVADVQSNEIAAGKQLALGGNVTSLDTLTINASGQWQEFNIDLTKYKGKGRYITLYLEPVGESTPSAYIDDISIDYAPTCFAVQNLSAEATGTTSLKVTWKEALNATSWNVKVSSTEIDPATTDGDIVKKATVSTTPEYVANNLKSNTTYYVYVSPACGELWTSTKVTTLYALTVPYYNDFSDEPTGSGTRPQYWITGNMGQATSQSYKPYVNKSKWSVPTGYTLPAEIVANSLYFYAYYYKTASRAALQPYAIMPELSNADVKDVVLSFWAHSSSSKVVGYCMELKIGVMTDPTDFSTLTEVTSVTLDTIKVPQYFFADMSSYTGSGKYIVFYMDNQTKNTSYISLDNLSITLASKPQRVTDVQAIDSTITETSAKLKWHENGDAKQWKIRLFTEEQTDPTEATPLKEFTVNDTIFEITGLTHSTQYFAYVQAVKGTESGMWSLVCPFWTKTGIWTVPFFEDFESYTKGSTTDNTLPPYYDLSGSTAKNFPYVYETYSSYGGGKTDATKKYMFYMVAGGSGKVSQIIFPKFDKPVNTLQMTFLAGAYSSNIKEQSATQIGVITADGTFHVVAENQVPAKSTWYEWFVDFSSYTGEDGQIAIRIAYNATLKKSVYVAIDNVSIVAIPECKRIANVKTDAVTATSATILWDKAGEETVWNLKVSTKPLPSPSDSTADAFDGQVASVMQALDKLEPNTTYYVYVQSVRKDKNCVGEWSQEMSFTTLCLPVALPYTEDFEGFEKEAIPDCYTLSGDVKDQTATRISEPGSYDKGKTLYIYQVAVEKKNYCAFPLLDCKDASELQLRMLVRPSSTGDATDPLEECDRYFYEVGVMTNPNDPATYVAMFTDSVIADGTTYGKDKYYSFAKYAGDIKGNMGKYIAIKVLPHKSMSLNKEYTGGMYIDDVKIERIASCVPPTELRVVEFDNDTVAFTWKTIDKTGNFRIRVFDKANANPDVDTPVKDVVVKDTASAVIKDLNGNTIYYAYIRKECSTTNFSTWSQYATWHTDCEEIQALPYVETFEACTSGQVPNCWEQITYTYSNPGGGGSGKITISAVSGAAKDSNLGLKIDYSSYGSAGKKAAYAITPRLNVSSFKDVVLYFDAKAYSGTTDFKIEAVESPSIDAESIEITTVKGISSDGWRTYYLDLADYYESAQEYQYLRFTTSSASILLDNIHITTNKSEIIPVQSLLLQSMTDTSATFSFTEVTPGVKQWMVEYGPKNFALGTGTKLTVDTTMVTLQGLAVNTAYDVYVRANVQGAVTTYTGPLQFTTPKKAASLPYYYNFGNAKENAELWTLVNTDAKGIECPNTFTFGDAKNVGATGSTALYIQHEGKYGYMSRFLNDELGNSGDWAMRYVNVPAQGTYTVGIKAKNPGCPPDVDEDAAYLCVALVPADRIPVNATLNGAFTRPNGTTGNVLKTMPEFNEFSVISKMYGVNDYTELANNVQITTPGTYVLLLYWYNISMHRALGDIYEPVAIDSVWIEEYECTEPSSHKVATITDSTATLSWFAGANDKFEVIASRYTKSPRPDELEEQDMVAHETFVGEPTYTVKGLKPNTSYAIYQRTICSDHATDWHEVDILTNCVAQTLPYTELFAETPECWYLSGAQVTTKDYRTQEMEDAGEEAEEWNCLSMSQNSYIVLPDFGVPANRLAVQLNVFNNGNYSKAIYEVGAVTSPYDMESYKALQTIKTTKTFGMTSSAGNPYEVENYTVMLHRYTGTGHHIVIKTAPTIGGNIKDLTVTLLPECVAPQLVEVTKVAETTAQLNWIAGNETEWTVALNTDTFTVNENPYLLKNLKNGTDYTVSLRAHCDATHASEWTAPVRFTTKCGVNSLPLIEKFEGLANEYDEDILLPINCWEQKYTTITLDSMIRRPNDKAFTDVNKRSNMYMKWVIPYQSVFDRYYNGVPHLRSDVYTDKSADQYNYKWLFSPKYEIGENTTLSFDLATATLAGRLLHTTIKDTIRVEMGTLNIAVTKDGVHFTKVKTIDLMTCDSTFHPVQVDLSAFAGDTLMVVFNHGMKYVSFVFNYPSIRINNMRMNCMETKPITATCYAECGRDYTDYGFDIKVDELPKLGETKKFERTESSTEGCDIHYVLTLTAIQSPSVATIHASICEGEFFEFGDHRITEPAPNGQPWRLSAPIAQSGCDSIIYLYLTVNRPVSSIVNETVCEGGQYMFVDTTLTTAGTYTRTTTSLVTGCDSIITLYLTVTPAPVVSQTATFCEGGTYDFNGTLLNKAGIYRDTTYAENGCMSITELTLSMNPVKRTSLGTEYINKGETYEFFGETLTATGSYSHTLQSAVTGCDSIVSVNLIVLTETTGHESMTVCANELPIVWKGQTITAEGVHQFDTLTTVGTDSIVLLSLHVIAPVTTDISESVCEGGKYQFGDTILTTVGTYTRTTTSLVTGCDSVITLFLTITPAVATPMGASICEGDTYDFNGKLLNQAGIYRDTTYAEDTHCMSITELSLVVNKPVSSTIIESICEGSKYQFGDTTLTTADTYTRTITSLVTGCDSVITLKLTVTPAPVTPQSKAICEGDTYDFAGKHLTTAGIYRDTTYAEDGCMSITELTLTVNKPVEKKWAETICEGGNYQFGDTTLTTAGTYTRILTSLATGCDSTITVSLAVTPAEVIKKDTSICEGESIKFGNQMLNAKGTYRDTTYAAETHCMSITELKLSVVESRTINVSDVTVHVEELPYIYTDPTGKEHEILPVGTPEGVYTMDTTFVLGSCTFYHFNITVKTTDAVDNIDVPSLHIYPTLIDKGQSVNLILDAAPANNNVVVEIHDMVGQLVATYRPASSHVVLGDFHTAGMYFVRVLTDDTVSGVGRVVVK